MENTTNISELPIKTNIPIIETSEMEEKIQISPNNYTIDEKSLHIKPEKHVTFTDNVDTSNKNIPEDENSKNKNDIFSISNELKLISLASLMFFIFIDSKFKKYIINILIQIFGNFLKTETGGTSKIGNLFYSFTFGIVLYLFTIFVDYTSLQFIF
tara:strand:+ start:2464 stop:2931 length:468 start_codon:yes stop_codon:yes gene_type:complete